MLLEILHCTEAELGASVTQALRIHSTESKVVEPLLGMIRDLDATFSPETRLQLLAQLQQTPLPADADSEEGSAHRIPIKIAVCRTKLGDPEGIVLLRGILQSETIPPTFRLSASEALLELGDRLSASDLRNILFNTATPFRCKIEAAGLLARLGCPDGLGFALATIGEDTLSYPVPDTGLSEEEDPRGESPFQDGFGLLGELAKIDPYAFSIFKKYFPSEEKFDCGDCVCTGVMLGGLRDIRTSESTEMVKDYMESIVNGDKSGLFDFTNFKIALKIMEERGIGKDSLDRYRAFLKKQESIQGILSTSESQLPPLRSTTGAHPDDVQLPSRLPPASPQPPRVASPDRTFHAKELNVPAPLSPARWAILIAEVSIALGAVLMILKLKAKTGKS